MGFINHTDLKLDKDVRAAIPEDWKWATFRERLSRAFACDDIFYSIEDLKEMKKEEGETLVAFARRFETASEPLIENGFLGEIERCGIFMGTLPIERREFVMESMPTKWVTFAQTRALALQTGGPDAKTHLRRVLEKLRKGVPGSHLEKQFSDEDGREFMPPDKSKVSRDSGEWKGGKRGNWKKNDGYLGRNLVPSVRFEEDRNTSEDEEEDIRCRISTDSEMGISNVVRTAEEPEQGEFWVSSVQFEEDPDPNDSLTVGVSSIRFESCEEDSDPALVCAKEVSEESEENGADNISLDINISLKGEDPRVMEGALADRTTTMKTITIDEEREDLKRTEEAQDELIEDQDEKNLLGEVVGAKISQAFEVMNEPDNSYELVRLFETVESDDNYELARLFETVEPDNSYELAQLFEIVEPDDNYELARLFETVEPDGNYELARLFEIVEPDDSNEFAQLFETVKPYDRYELAQLFETIDMTGNDVGNSVKTVASQNLETMKDIGNFIMDQSTTVNVERESDGGLLEGQDYGIRLPSDQEGRGKTIVEVKSIEDADHLRSMPRGFKELSELKEGLQVKESVIDDNDSVKTENWVAGFPLGIRVRALTSASYLA
ncbi:hypothetical protein CBR_g39763 [Chara braunii]|uniref:Uncharacterized protein n=1 Tax=Chara braunii TaxID=69332 RepID=A0A388LS82_CHABU|nr:hypothetical protein CBR_g39763 [Chara braunii]|eukprot:GBG85198.1 hypothetical protein CBR_g39763 [Chara braunii]